MKKILSFLLASFLIASPLFADATTAARERNFVNDKANSIPITASYMDGEFDNLITKVNSKVLAKATAPSSPTAGDTWVDTSVTPPFVKVYDGTNWTTTACTKGADVASATATTLGNDGCFFDITGTTTITSVTAKPAGFIAILQFDGILTFTDGSNLKLDGNFTTAAGSTITLISDGTNWWEIARSPNSFTPTAANALAGSIVQVVNTQTGAVATGTTAMPVDDTVPQSTEGDEYMTLAITPTNTNNKLKIEVLFNYAHSAAVNIGLGLFQDSTASALAATQAVEISGNNTWQMSLTHYMTAGTTSATTFKVRAGGTTGSTLTFNGHSGGRIFGGVMASSITIEEIKV